MPKISNNNKKNKENKDNKEKKEIKKNKFEINIIRNNIFIKSINKSKIEKKHELQILNLKILVKLIKRK